MSTMRVMSVPRSVDIAITGRCNLTCQYCFYADEMVARSDLSTEQWLTFFDELGALGVMDVTLTGGEVFTRRDLFTLIDGVVANRMRYTLLTNGTLITEKVLDQFEVGKRRLRLNSIQISIDGATPGVHNQSRPKSFDRAIRAVRLLKAAKLPVNVRMTLNRHNVGEIEAVAELLLDDIGLRTFSINEAYPCGAVSRAESGAGIMLTPEQRHEAMRVSLELFERYEGRVKATAGPLAFAHNLQAMEQRLAAGQTSLPGRGTLSACNGVFNGLGILHDGTMVPCHQVSWLRIGNILTDDLVAVWREHQLMEAMRQRRTIPLGELATCRDCKYQGFCTGGCPGGSLFLEGELNARNPMDCYRILNGEEEYTFALDDTPPLIRINDIPVLQA